MCAGCTKRNSNTLDKTRHTCNHTLTWTFCVLISFAMLHAAAFIYLASPRMSNGAVLGFWKLELLASNITTSQQTCWCIDQICNGRQYKMDLPWCQTLTLSTTTTIFWRKARLAISCWGVFFVSSISDWYWQ